MLYNTLTPSHGGGGIVFFRSCVFFGNAAKNIITETNKKCKKESLLMEEKFKKTVDARLATIEGHIKAVRKMLDDDKSCVEIITQLSAIQRAVKKTGAEVLKNHMGHCIKDVMREGAEPMAEELNNLLGSYLWLD